MPRYRPASRGSARTAGSPFSARRTSSLGDAAGAAACTDGDAGAPGDGLQADEGLEAAGRAALAGRAVGIDGDVAELAAVAVRTAEELAVDEDAAADSDLTEDVDEVLEIPCDPLPVLGERGEVGLVVGTHGKLGEARGELVGNRDLGPAEVRGAEKRSGLCLDEAGKRNCGTGGTRSSAAIAASAFSAIRARRFSTGPGDERRLSVCTRCS